MRQLKITQSITNRDSQSLDKYLLEISKMKMVSPDEEAALCIRIKAGDKVAAQQLIRANLRFVVSVAKQYQNRGILLCDLVSEGNIGLINSVTRFDSTRGFKFISYAVWWIRQAILVALAEKARMVRLPANRVIIAGRMQRKIEVLEQDLERAPSEEELADAMNINVAEVTHLMKDSGRYVSLDAPVLDGEGVTMMDSLPAHDDTNTDRKLYYTESLHTEIQRSMRQLTQRQQEILCSVFGIGIQQLSLEEIGKKFDLSPERIRQIKERAIKKLRTKDGRGILRSFL